MPVRAKCLARRVEVDHREREVVLVRRPAVRAGRSLVDEDLGVTGCEDRAARPLGHRRGAHQRAVERGDGSDLVREERDLGDVSHVAISNSRRTSFSEVLRSVDSLRVPTMSAHGRS